MQLAYPPGDSCKGVRAAGLGRERSCVVGQLWPRGQPGSQQVSSETRLALQGSSGLKLRPYPCHWMWVTLWMDPSEGLGCQPETVHLGENHLPYEPHGRVQRKAESGGVVLLINGMQDPTSPLPCLPSLPFSRAALGVYIYYRVPEFLAESSRISLSETRDKAL